MNVNICSVISFFLYFVFLSQERSRALLHPGFNYIHACFKLNGGELFKAAMQPSNCSCCEVKIKTNKLRTLSFPASGTMYMQPFRHPPLRQLAEEVKFVELFSSYLKEFDSLLFSNPWLPVKCDVEQCGSSCSPYGNVDKSIWRIYPV